MPSSTTPTSRRSTASGRQRENRVQSHPTQPNAGPTARRRRSRSPEARAKRPATIAAGPGFLPSSYNTALVRSPYYEGSTDRERTKAKIKSRPQTVLVDDDDPSIITNIVPDLDAASSTRLPRSKRKERSRSRSREAATRPHRKGVTPDVADEGEEPLFSGPLAQADYNRMKQEVENLRKQLSISKKTIHKQSKVIDELRSELKTTQELHGTHRAEMEKLKRQSKKSEDLVTTVESSLTCQICMELLLKPYGLSPCGHVLCMSCLLEWFKSAPPGEDEMLDDEYPDALLYRKKTCPCCRTIVRNRPIPLYLVKSLASAVDKARAPNGVARPSPPPDDEDPWAGIFRDPTDYENYWSTDEDDDDDEEEDDEDDAEDGEEYDDDDDYWSFDGYGTGEDDERYDGPYVTARWAPPGAHVSADEYPYLDADSEEFKMLRRGATLQMIELFQMNYSHDLGLTAVVEDDNVVYLGWNIELHPDDETGEEYMDWILADMYDRPERWRMIHDALDGTWVAHRLVPQYEVEEYDNTDSEMWTAESDEDEDM
ncbi:hypothetical protein BV20DRAFT_968377 [Pilatotrama ljubarskyi]|nr:hypothetical protein BV20DRAFT_968377 [Pilatotrama ljubarskyi]